MDDAQQKTNAAIKYHSHQIVSYMPALRAFLGPVLRPGGGRRERLTGAVDPTPATRSIFTVRTASIEGGGFPPAGSFLQLLAFPWFSALGLWIATDRP